MKALIGQIQKKTSFCLMKEGILSKSIAFEGLYRSCPRWPFCRSSLDITYEVTALKGPNVSIPLAIALPSFETLTATYQCVNQPLPS